MGRKREDQLSAVFKEGIMVMAPKTRTSATRIEFNIISFVVLVLRNFFIKS